MKKRYLSLFFIVLIVFFPPVGAENPPAPIFKLDDLTIQSSGGDHHFIIELAQSHRQMEYGLMFRKNLEPDHGMLFLWEKEAKIAMWMKNTLIPLDMVFLGSDGVIVQIEANATPESLDIIKAKEPVRAVIELAGGITAVDGIKVGDRVIYSAFKP